MNNVLDHAFHNAASAVGNGNFLDVGYFKFLTVETFASAENTARTITFYSKGPSGALTALVGVRVSASPMVTAVNTTGIAETWQFDVTGLHKVYMALSSITGGTVSVVGRAVS